MKKLFTLVAALVLSVNMMWADFCVAHNGVLNSNVWQAAGDLMTEREDFPGVYEITFPNVGTSQVQFKVTVGSWTTSYNKYDQKISGVSLSIVGSNVAFTLSSPADVVIRFDTRDDVNLISVQPTSDPVDPEPVITYNYYLVGTLAENGWNAGSATGMVNDEITRSVAAGTYEFKILTALGSWDGALGYSNVNADCSDNGYKDNGGNVKVTLNAAGDVHVAIVDGQICVTGDFGDAVITSYTIAGETALMGSSWSTTDANNDMINNAGVWSLTKNGVELTAKDYEYKVVANHTWGVSDYPASGNNKLTISEAGVYDITFTWNPKTPELTAVATKTYTVNFSNNWASFCAAEKVAIPEVVVAYKGAVNGDVLTLTPVEGNVIPAGVGVMLKSTEASATLTVSEKTAADFSGNQLLGTTADYSAPANAYCYSKSQNAFAPVAAGFSIPANKAYLVLASAPERISIVEADHNFVTAVENVEMTAEVKKVVVNGQMMILRDGKTFDVMGRIVK